MSAHQSISFPATRADALQAAVNFAPHTGQEYARLRNYVIPGHPHVSKLSPAIRSRLISENELVQTAIDALGSMAHCEKFVQEVYWRSYWRSWLELRPAIWSAYTAASEKLSHQLSPETQRRVLQIENGESGVEPIDNFARELVETGFLHNHARMWFASYWIHVEKLPWQLGADFFERHLICACSASNTLSWRWVAGLQTAGKPYLIRASNLEKYCDPAYLGHFEGRAQLEHTASDLFELQELPAAHMSDFQVSVEPCSGKIGLWIHEDDFTPETSVLQTIEVDAICVSVLGAPEKSARSNGLRREYRLHGASDAASRAHGFWNAPVEQFEASNQDELQSEIVGWARDNHLKSVVTLKPFVGPAFAALDDLKAELEKPDIDLQLLRRSEDALLLQNANAGFFRFWQSAKQTF